ncbi:Protein-N(5)-glutamine methyltransferase PrmC, methylates polypeptide chain release factors RF1 and RF2 [Enhygromyxa salina]|uniref:Release factor glutamine methyltransferase n=1 Tax=Enhygromyxa salina TaxID=215803 RepID=A0A0C2CXF4_9BACT|nr:peptide chain release factor N(5)-glutamine methyltransferase [Enhygromyxa salina]KIG15681.1 Protein-N(5)-glutamine methyltransferase PrmC, methylates polypeptide chain release factors RF1 and RF2 [Enhygromyxa salina]
MAEAERRARWTVRELLTWTSERFASLGIPDARVDAEHLLAHALGCARIELYVQHDRLLDESDRAGFRELVRRRLAREPVAYIEGTRGFHALDLDLAVDRRALIPRPETEHLVDWLLESLRPPPAPLMHVLDVGTGSGAIALAVAKARYEVQVTAVDISAEALALARHNIERLGLEDRVTCVQSDLLEAVEVPERGPQRGFDAIAANLPYIPTVDLDGLEPEVRVWEPTSALDGGPDGLTFVRQLISAVVECSALIPGGRLLLEIGVGQAGQVESLLREAGFLDVQSRSDYARIPRVVSGAWPSE